MKNSVESRNFEAERIKREVEIYIPTALNRRNYLYTINKDIIKLFYIVLKIKKGS